MKTNIIRLISLLCSLLAAFIAFLAPRLRVFYSPSRPVSLNELAAYCGSCEDASMLSLAFTAMLAVSLLLVLANVVNLSRHPERVGFVSLPRSKDAAMEEEKKSNGAREVAGLAAVAAGSAGFLYFLDKSKIIALFFFLGGVGAYVLLTRKTE